MPSTPYIQLIRINCIINYSISMHLNTFWIKRMNSRKSRETREQKKRCSYEYFRHLHTHISMHQWMNLSIRLWIGSTEDGQSLSCSLVCLRGLFVCPHYWYMRLGVAGEHAFKRERPCVMCMHNCFLPRVNSCCLSLYSACPCAIRMCNANASETNESP